MSAFDNTYSTSRNGKVADPVLAEGANPMQSMDLGTSKHAAEGVRRVGAAAVQCLLDHAGTLLLPCSYVIDCRWWPFAVAG
jgi:hypothetical protein